MDNLDLLKIIKTHVSGFFRGLMNERGSVGEGSSDPDPDPDPNPDPNSNPNPDPDTSSKKWHEGLGMDPTISSHASLEKFKDINGLAKSYIELESKLGANIVNIPDKDAKPEKWDAFYNAIGRPEKAEGYETASTEGLHQSLIPKPEQVAEFKKFAHSIGLTKAQALALDKWNNDRSAGILKQSEEANQQSINDTLTKLRAEWGGQYDDKLNRVLKIVEKHGSPELSRALEKDKLGNNPHLLKFLDVLTSKLGEDSLGDRGSGSLTMTPEEAEMEIKKIRADKTHPFNDGEHMLHDEAVKKVQELYKIASRGK